MSYKLSAKEYEYQINRHVRWLNKLVKETGKEYRIEKRERTKCLYLVQRNKYGDDRFVTGLSTANEILTALQALITIEGD